MGTDLNAVKKVKWVWSKFPFFGAAQPKICLAIMISSFTIHKQNNKMGTKEIKHMRCEYRTINTVDVAGLEAKGSDEREKDAGTAITEMKLK